ncbi:hypothetical protein FN846DRAFT_785494 [Sphaerosporella brunnea]|uniref:EamA domain-containing protein n=1 Tax=Sphaerosporella brunnea TaxID=1250544 RepID=A0A5J5EIL3_9PEZI|nr:hypothetical protein FN846DRAFT_785494 [Sphaerosporella brunnea]
MSTNWIHLAVASGLCAATNGLFAKLTTTTLTSTLAASLAVALSLELDSNGPRAVELFVRGLFFSLNLLFNAIMWGLFTAALAKGSSATTVSVVNTSANFMATALFGWLVFAEALPPMWWVGASMLVAGSVTISRRETHEKKPGYTAVAGNVDEAVVAATEAEEAAAAAEAESGSSSGSDYKDDGHSRRRA